MKRLSNYTSEDIAIFYRDYPDKAEAFDLLCDMTGYPGMVLREILRFKRVAEPAPEDVLPGMERYDQIIWLWEHGYSIAKSAGYLGIADKTVIAVRRRGRMCVNE